MRLRSMCHHKTQYTHQKHSPGHGVLHSSVVYVVECCAEMMLLLAGLRHFRVSVGSANTIRKTALGENVENSGTVIMSSSYNVVPVT